MSDDKIELIKIENEEAVLLNGFDDAILGMAHSYEKSVVAYDMRIIIDMLMKDMSIDETEAREYFEYNILGSHISEYNPVFIDEF